MSWPFMAIAAPIGPAVAVARLYLTNAEIAWRAAEETDMPFYLLCALLDQETKGRNIYGHDSGGVFSQVGPHPVTEKNFAEFYRRVVDGGERSNGVGPMQITSRGFFPLARKLGYRLEEPLDNMLFGIREIWMPHIRRAQRERAGDWIRWAGTWYNAGPDERKLVQPYADQIAAKAQTWKGRVG